jgi:hypothetical protein
MSGPAMAAGLGRACALGIECARDLSRHAARYPELFPARPFDPGFFHSLGLVGAFGSPWATADELRAVNRAALWVFAADLLIDHVATSREEVAALVGDCVAVAAGRREPDSPLTRFLAELRDDLGGDSRWCDQLERMLTAMQREWHWRASGAALEPDDRRVDQGGDGVRDVDGPPWIWTSTSRTRTAAAPPSSTSRTGCPSATPGARPASTGFAKPVTRCSATSGC